MEEEEKDIFVMVAVASLAVINDYQLHNVFCVQFEILNAFFVNKQIQVFD